MSDDEAEQPCIAAVRAVAGGEAFASVARRLGMNPSTVRSMASRALEHDHGHGWTIFLHCRACGGHYDPHAVGRETYCPVKIAKVLGPMD